MKKFLKAALVAAGLMNSGTGLANKDISHQESNTNKYSHQVKDEGIGRAVNHVKILNELSAPVDEEINPNEKAPLTDLSGAYEDFGTIGPGEKLNVLPMDMEEAPEDENLPPVDLSKIQKYLDDITSSYIHQFSREEIKINKTLNDISNNPDKLNVHKVAAEIFPKINPQKSDVEDRLGHGKSIIAGSRIDPHDIITNDGKIDLTKYTASVSNLLLRYSQVCDINPKLLHALAIAETNFGLDPDRLSDKGAMGVLQVMPDNLKAYSPKNKDPYEAACQVIWSIGRYFGIDVSYKSNLTKEQTIIVAASYNYGLGRVKKNPKRAFLEITETNDYIRIVLSSMYYNKLIIAQEISNENGYWKATKIAII